MDELFIKVCCRSLIYHTCDKMVRVHRLWLNVNAAEARTGVFYQLNYEIDTFATQLLNKSVSDALILDNGFGAGYK